VTMAYGRHSGMKVRIARFQNCYGPEGTWRGGREKAPAAICRKVAMAEDGGTIPVWGDGTAIRAYTYVDDLVEGVYMLMQSDLKGADHHRRRRVRDGGRAGADGDQCFGAGEIHVEHVEGPVGVQARNFDKSRIQSLGWEAKTSLKEGIGRTYPWIGETGGGMAATEGELNQ